ncbi:MAG: hypothetical protein HYZ54_01930 [Ignavibacteriae bacterium]|nr:hypothetical protein [Ignavibacteriota bacterium]
MIDNLPIERKKSEKGWGSESVCQLQTEDDRMAFIRLMASNIQKRGDENCQNSYSVQKNTHFFKKV